MRSKKTFKKSEIALQLASEKETGKILNMMEKFYSIDQYSFDIEKSKTNFINFIYNPSLGRFWLITKNDDIIGYVVVAFGFSFEYGGRDAFIDELFIEEEYRGKGIGEYVMNIIVGESKKLAVRALHLEVERHNKKGINLYLKLGFTGNNRNLLTKKIN